ncbi:MAG: autotransporter-associated beta strand repeat-containing protein [Pirellulales bacterium]|nr:autotransporter-associated beta strand repeat-containing protein [Pirellulales bacterium]
MKLLLRLVVILFAAAWMTSAAAVHADDYYWDNPMSGSYHDPNNWSPPGYVPIDPADKVIINNGGTAEISADIGDSVLGGVGEIQLGNSTGEGHVVQTAGNVYVDNYFLVGYGSAPTDLPTYTMQGGSLTLRETGGYWGFRIGQNGPGTMTVTGSDSMYPTSIIAKDIALIGYGSASDGTLDMSGYSQASFDSGLWAGYSGNSSGLASGTINLSGNATLTASNGSLGCWNYSYGEINISGSAKFTANGWYNIGDNWGDNWPDACPGEGAVTVEGDGTLETYDFRVGSSAYGVGTVTIGSTSGTATWNSNGWAAIGVWDGRGELVLNSGGQVNVADSQWFALGEDSGSEGTLTMDGGAISVGADGGISVGLYHNISAAWNQTGGSFTSESVMEVGRYGGVGTATFSGTAQATTTALRVGVNWGDNGADLGVGEVVVDGNAQVTVTGVGTYGNDYANTITLAHGGGDGTWNQNGGTTTCANAVVVSEYDYWDESDITPGVGALNLNGGTFACPGMMVRANSDVVTGTAGTVNFNGGTLKATGDSSDFFTIVDPGITPTATLTLKVQAGGAVIDTDTYNVTISNPLAEDAGSTGGGLTKLGEGTLTLTSSGHSYTGDTVVSAGTLSTTDAAMMDDGADLWIAMGAVMDLDFTGTDTIGKLYLNGSAQATGTWGATGSGAAHVDDVYFSGLGMVLVTQSAVQIPGDADRNGVVDEADATRLAENWGVQTGATWDMGDFNGDYKVDAADAAVLAANWGATAGGGEEAPVPEPSTLLQLTLGLMSMACFRRR